MIFFLAKLPGKILSLSHLGVNPKPISGDSKMDKMWILFSRREGVRVM